MLIQRAACLYSLDGTSLQLFTRYTFSISFSSVFSVPCGGVRILVMQKWILCNPPVPDCLLALSYLIQFGNGAQARVARSQQSSGN